MNKNQELTLILTPNRRLALYLQTTWSEVNILPLTNWLETIWSGSILLNPHQEYLLWREIITTFAKEKPLLNLTKTIEQAQQAYTLLRQWRIDLTNPLFTISEDTATFQAWTNEFTAKCQNNNWIAVNDIIDKINLDNITLPKQITLVGFDQITSQLQYLLDNIKTKCQIEFRDPNNKISKQQRLSAPDQEQELISMALWAKQHANATIGCVIPNLATIRSKVENIFNKIIGANFDISIGQKLKDFPIIAAALKTLKSPACSASTPFNKGGYAPEDWVQYFTELLQEGNWPGIYDLNHKEQQVMVRWDKLLEEFASLNLVVNKLDYKQALQHLNTLADNIVFQPQLQQPAQIKILGTLEAAGINFDQLWIMGLTSQNWPPAPQPNPFIPIQLQRELNMPHASSERELQFCRLLTDRFARSATNIIYSYPLQEQDQLLSVSPLIQHVTEITLADLNLPKFTPYNKKNIRSKPITAKHAPKVTAEELILGGSKIWQLQAACPFRAFAECRLHAKEKTEPKFGLDVRERGLLVHEMLEKTWHLIGGHKQLCAYKDPELKNIVKKIVDKILKPLDKPLQIKNVEQPRLEKLLYDWLTLEKTRTPFTVIAQEQSQQINLGNNKKISIRIDRIDQQEDDSLLIIDYKTGKTSTNDWFGDRPNDPQLPLYCVTSNQPIQGLMYAQIKTGSLKFNPVGATLAVAHITKWRTVLNKLSQDFCNGNATVDPKNGDQTCRICKLHGLCRV